MTYRAFLTAVDIAFMQELARGKVRWTTLVWMRDDGEALPTLVHLGMITMNDNAVSLTEAGLAKLVEIALTE